MIVKIVTLFALCFVSGCSSSLDPLDRVNYGMTRQDIEALLGKPDTIQKTFITDEHVRKSVVQESGPDVGALAKARIGDRILKWEYVRGQKTLVVIFLNDGPKPANVFTWEPADKQHH